MAKRALLIGSQTGGLTGVHGDIEVMDDALRGVGFDTATIIEHDAAYDGIVARYRGLIDDAGAGDAVVVYYSGHGGRQPNPDHEADPTLPTWLQYLLPYDIDDRSGGAFRGLLAEELSLLQWELTQKTTNVTTILDCCHSARMSRDPRMIPKADDRISVPMLTMGDRWTRLRRALVEAGTNVDANPSAVQIVGCSPDQSAYELADSSIGGTHGALTASLVTILRSGRTETLTWRDVMDLVRPAVMDVVPMQRPDVLGPNADRFLFSLEERSSSGVLPVLVEGAQAMLDGAALFGLAEGDTYAIVGAGGDTRRPLATGVVDLVAGGRARLLLDGADPADLAPGTVAHPVDVSAGRRPVAVTPADHPDRARVVDALGSSNQVQVVDRPGDVLATVRLSDGGMVVLDAAGEPLTAAPRTISPGTLQLLAGDLRTLARATHVRELASGTGAAALPGDVEVTYARRTADGEVVLAASGEHLFAGDRIIVRAKNVAGASRYLSVLDVGLAGAVSLVTTSEPDGVTLAPDESYVVGANVSGHVDGLPLFWPDAVPATAPRPETLVTIVADRKVDGLARLTQPGVRSRAATAAPTSTLEAILADLDTGRRDVRPASSGEDATRFVVHRFDFVLHPVGREDSDAEPDFDVDERPDPSFRLVVPRGAAPPGRVAIRLTELTVHSNRAILGATVRVDAMVVTVPAAADGEPYRAATARFDRVKDGDRLPFDNLLVYEGTVGRFLDLAVWVARDDQKELDLADMLVKETGSDHVKGAVAVLAGLAVAAPAAAVVAGSVGAVATLVRVGAGLLDAATGKSIGVYRTSLLPHERFGAGEPTGRHPSNGLITAQDMSFAFEVIDLDGT